MAIEFDMVIFGARKIQVEQSCTGVNGTVYGKVLRFRKHQVITAVYTGVRGQPDTGAVSAGGKWSCLQTVREIIAFADTRSRDHRDVGLWVLSSNPDRTVIAAFAGRTSDGYLQVSVRNTLGCALDEHIEK